MQCFVTNVGINATLRLLTSFSQIPSPPPPPFPPPSRSYQLIKHTMNLKMLKTSLQEGESHYIQMEYIHEMLSDIYIYILHNTHSLIHTHTHYLMDRACDTDNNATSPFSGRCDLSSFNTEWHVLSIASRRDTVTTWQDVTLLRLSKTWHCYDSARRDTVTTRQDVTLLWLSKTWHCYDSASRDTVTTRQDVTLLQLRKMWHSYDSASRDTVTTQQDVTLLQLSKLRHCYDSARRDTVTTQQAVTLLRLGKTWHCYDSASRDTVTTQQDVTLLRLSKTGHCYDSASRAIRLQPLQHFYNRSNTSTTAPTLLQPLQHSYNRST